MSEKVFVCLVCSRRKVYINIAKKVGWCHYCSKALGPSQVKEYIGDTDTSRGPNILSPLPSLEPAWENQEARKFLHSREVYKKDVPSIGYDPEGKRLYFRIWSPSPDLPGTFHTRAISKDGTWRVVPGTSKGGYFFGSPLGKRVCIVEGIWDAIRIGPGALSLLGSSLSITQETYLRNTFSHVLIYMDPDEAGRKARKEIYSRLLKIGVKCSVMFGAEKEPADYPPGHPAIVAVQEWLRGGEHVQDD